MKLLRTAPAADVRYWQTREFSVNLHLVIKRNEMNAYDDLDIYNGNAEHDMMVDYDYHVNTGEVGNYSDDRPSSFAHISANSRQSNTQSPYDPRKRLKRYRRRISFLQSKIEEDKKLIQNIERKKQSSELTHKLFRLYRFQKQQAEYRIEKSSKKIAKLQENIPSLKAAIIQGDNKAITIISVMLTCSIIIYFSILFTTIIEV